MERVAQRCQGTIWLHILQQTPSRRGGDGFVVQRRPTRRRVCLQDHGAGALGGSPDGRVEASNGTAHVLCDVPDEGKIAADDDLGAAEDAQGAAVRAYCKNRTILSVRKATQVCFRQEHSEGTPA